MKDSWEGLSLDCPTCRGTGFYKVKKDIRCDSCKGTGTSGVISSGKSHKL